MGKNKRKRQIPVHFTMLYTHSLLCYINRGSGVAGQLALLISKE